MIKRCKDHLYFLKRWFVDIFLYPKSKLTLDNSLDYDEYWKEKRGGDSARLSSWQLERANIIAGVLKGQSGVSVGDIGCGDGAILQYIDKQVSLGKMKGYDTSEFILEKMKAIGIDTALFDVNKEESWSEVSVMDYYLLLEILEHIPNSEKFLHTVLTKASKGVFFSFPNSGFFIYRLRLLFGKFPKQWATFPNEHLRFWTMADLNWWLKALGYRDYKVFCYKGVPLLNRIWPALFAAAFVVYLPKEFNNK